MKDIQFVEVHVRTGAKWSRMMYTNPCV